MLGSRLLASAWRGALRCARCFSSSPDILFRGKFFNRAAELDALSAYLKRQSIGAPGRILLLSGPKDSGKSALLREYWLRQRAGAYGGVPAFVDLRVGSNQNPHELARNLSASFLRSLQVKVELKESLLGGPWSFELGKHLAVETPWGGGTVQFAKDGQSDMNMVMAAFESYMSRLPQAMSGYTAGFPTFFIDEANLLARWATDIERSRNVEALLRFLVRVSKQEGAANVVLASSDSFFKDWLYVSSIFRGHNVTFATIGHLSEMEAREFVLSTIMASDSHNEQQLLKLQEEALALWDDVFAHFGGAMILLHEFVELVLAHGPGTLQERWEATKTRHVMRSLEFVESGQLPQGLSPLPIGSHYEFPTWTRDQWHTVMNKFTESPDGVLSFESLADSVPEHALISMIHYDFVQFRPYSGWDRDVGDVSKLDWPIVMPSSKLQLVAMKNLKARGSFAAPM